MTCFTKGGINHYRELDGLKAGEVLVMPRERIGYFGWDGFGGSVMQWHPELKIGFGYVPSKLHWYNAYSHIGTDLQKETIECIKRVYGPKQSFSYNWKLHFIKQFTKSFYHEIQSK